MESKSLLITKTLALVPIHTNDPILIREIVGWLNDPTIVRYSEQRHRRHTPESQWEYIQSFKGRDVYWGIYLNGTNPVGTISYRIDPNNNIAEVGILIGSKPHWSKGIGTEAWQRVTDYLLWLGIRKVEAGCMAVNTGMMAICQKTGMVEEGRKNDHFIFEGKTCDLINWGKFRETS